MAPLVSVLMPMRNAARYVEDAVRSVLDQSHKDFELVVVDDGSTDDSRARVERLADPRVRIVDGPRRGFPAAFNAALAAATGDVLMQCDSDDLYPPDRIRRQLEDLQAHPEVSAVCGGMSIVDAAGQTAVPFPAEGPSIDLTDELLSGKTRTSFCTYAVRADRLRASGGMREFFETACDLDLQIRLAEAGRIRYTPIPTYVYRLHDQSVTHQGGDDRGTFFDTYVRELRRQRASGRKDDLELGNPAQPPPKRATGSSSRELQGMLLGQAWLAHRKGEKGRAMKLGFRAIAKRPISLAAWKSLAALLFRPVP